MSKRPHSPAPSNAQCALLDALGGPKDIAVQVSAILNLVPALKPQAVSNWRRRGIPYAYRPILQRMAKGAGISVPDDFMQPERVPMRIADDDDEGLPFLAGGA